MNNKAVSMSLIAGVMAAVMVWSYISSREEEWSKRYGVEKAVVVAKEDISELTQIREDMLESRNIPEPYRQPLVAESIQEVAHLVALTPIKKGEQITLNRIAPLGFRTGLSRQVGIGKRAISIPVNENNAISKLIKPGDRIDIIVTFDPPGSGGRGTQLSKTLFQDVPVLSVGKMITSHVPRKEEKDDSGRVQVRNLNEIDSYSTITVEVDPPNAQLLAYVMNASDTKMTMSLRNNDDTERVSLPNSGSNDVLGTDSSRGVRTPASVPR